MTAVEYMKQWLRTGWAGGPVHIPTPPGYMPDYPPASITVPDASNGVGGGGSSTYPTVEAALQRAVAQMANQFLTQGLSDAMVSMLLGHAADVAAPYTAGQDPGAVEPLRSELIAKYVAIYRTAVTPV